MQPPVVLEELIGSHPFLNGLDRRFIDLLVPCASVRRFSSHQCIFAEGGEADHFYLIDSGSVLLETAVANQGSFPIQTLGAGDPLGCSWLFPPYKWFFTALSLVPTEVISFGAGFLRERAEEDLEFGNELLRRISRTVIERMQVMRKGLVASCCSPSQIRSVGVKNPDVGSYVV